MFRDGVGDSMMEMVADHEVSQLRSCFDTFEQYVDSPPGLVVIVVKKRISARLFAVKNRVSHDLVSKLLPIIKCRGKFLLSTK